MAQIPRLEKATVYSSEIEVVINNGVTVHLSVVPTTDETRPCRLHVSFSGIGAEHTIEVKDRYANGLDIHFPVVRH